MKTLLTLLLCGTVCASVNAAIVLSDTFPYTNGVLTNASSGKWKLTSGSGNQMNVTNGTVELFRSESEDVAASLSVSYASSSGTTIYSKFSIFVLATDALANGNYFTHLDGGVARARVFMVTNGAVPGKFRLGLANGANNASNIWPADLNTNQTYTVVTRHVISNATATLWVNPASVSDASITAPDVVSAQTINSFALRQDTGIGRFTLDDLVVATSFAEALSGNESPSIANIPDQQIGEGASTAALPFLIGDAETAAGALSLSASASNSNLVQSIVLGGSDSNRTITVTAPAGQTGTVAVTVFVTDGTTTNSDSFLVTIIPALLFSDDFNYVNGALITNGTPPWTHHSGATGEIQVAGGKITLTDAQSEDVNVVLPYGPFATNSGVVLYASFLVNFSQRPTSGGDYIAHFNTSSPRGRLFVNRAGAAAGNFRLGVANGTNSISEQLAIDLATNVSHLVVLRYNPATAITTVWANPAAETDPGTNATDVASASAISTFAFREDPAIGVFTVDDLRIGLTFAAVTSVDAPSLRIETVPASQVRIAWPAPSTGFALQTNGNLGTANWSNLGATPAVTGGENILTNPAAGTLFYRLKK